MANILRVSKNTVIYGLGSVSTQLVGLVTLMFLTGHMRPEEFGVVAMLGILHLLALPIFKMGLDTSIGMYYFDKEGEERDRLIWTAFAILLASAAVMFLAGSLFSSKIGLMLLKDSDRGGLVVAQLLVTTLDLLAMPLVLNMQLREKAAFFISVNIAAVVMLSALQLLFVAGLKYGVYGWLAGLVISKLFSLAMFFAASFAGRRFSFDSAAALSLVKSGAPLIPSFAFLFLIQNSGKYMLERMRGLDDLGIFNVGFSVGSAMDLAVSAFCTAWFPFFQSFASKKHEAGPLFGKVTLYYALCFSSVSICFFAAARPFCEYFVNSSFIECYKTIGVVSAASFASGFFYMFLPGVYYAKKVWLVSLTQGVCCVLILGLNYILISCFGMTGVAMALVCCHALMGAGQYFVNRSLRLWSHPCDWGRIGGFVLKYILFAAAFMLLSHMLPARLYLAVAPFVVLLYAVTAWNFLDRAEKDGLRKFAIEMKRKFL